MVNVIGLGYIGLPTALILAAGGIDVQGTDYNLQLIEELKNGHKLFKEPGLKELYEDAKKNKITFSKDYAVADYYIIAVQTPYEKRHKKLNPMFVIDAVMNVLMKCPNQSVIIIESTIPPGTINKHIRPLVENELKQYGKLIHLVHAPERIIPGNMIKELRNNSRVIGADNNEIGERVKELYGLFCKGEIVLTDIRTAEMSKVIENTYRDINIAFANEMAKICHSDELDVYEIIRIANKHPRVNILQPGPGVGGHCISVDPWFLVGDYPGLANIVLAARNINDSMPEFVLERINQVMTEHGINDIKRVGLYGLTYKENVDDVRESPTLQMLDCMKRHLASGIKIYDPYIKYSLVENQYYELEAFLKEIDLIVIMVGHDEIKRKKQLLANKIIFDTKNVMDLDHAIRL